MKLISTNPFTQRIIGEYDVFSVNEVDERIEKVSSYFHTQPLSLDQRKKCLIDISKSLLVRKEELALLITQEMGKVIRESRAEVEKCSWVCEYYANHAADFLAQTDYVKEGFHGFVRYEPLGVVLAIMPWNFPLWQVFRFAAPAFMAGNGMLLKHASNVTGCSKEIERIFQDATSQNCFSSLLINTDQVKSVVDDKRVEAVTLTGSENAGSIVASQAAAQIKKSVLELGGSDPFIVFSDADIDKAVESGVASRYLNCGQSCIGAKRFLIQRDVYEEFVKKFKSRVSELKVGNPELEETDIGPLAENRFKSDALVLIEDAVQSGANLAGAISLQGALLSPGILEGIPSTVRVFNEEMFGPVASMYVFDHVKEAIELANCTPFGLGSSVWSSSKNTVQEMIFGLESGCVFVNDMVKSDPRLPFGGIKKSGYGRELAREGMLEFVNQKTVVINQA